MSFNKEVGDFVNFCQKEMGFWKKPKVLFIKDENNAKNTFGRTAHYDPVNMEISLYVVGRHPKDILRSLGHELVHHKQNEDGRIPLDKLAGEGYAQESSEMELLEREAMQEGQWALRKYEDLYKKGVNKPMQAENKLKKMIKKAILQRILKENKKPKQKVLKERKLSNEEKENLRDEEINRYKIKTPEDEKLFHGSIFMGRLEALNSKLISKWTK